jgi:DNA-binding transcriptional LysR family regulator
VMLAQLAGPGLGTAILPKSVAAAMQSQVHALTIRSPSIRSRIEIAWRSGGHRSTAADALIRHACDYLDDVRIDSA